MALPSSQEHGARLCVAWATRRKRSLFSPDLCRDFGGHSGFLPFGGFCSAFFPLQNESELFGRTIRVNLAKPMRIKEGSSRPGELVPERGEQHPRGCSELRASAFLLSQTLRQRPLEALPPISGSRGSEQHPNNQKYSPIPWKHS